MQKLTSSIIIRNNSNKPLQGNWPTTERVYRYTKHRIPGYDYEELEFLDTRQPQRCDERSVWTHCLCQFTCTEPNIVDCYTPCNSGCECREDFVYDPKSRQCVLPEQCPPDDDYFLYWFCIFRDCMFVICAGFCDGLIDWCKGRRCWAKKMSLGTYVLL